MAKLVDALDLGSSGVVRGGSSPFTCTIIKIIELCSVFLYLKLLLRILHLFVMLCMNKGGFMEEKKCNCGPECECGCQEGKECTCEGKCKCDDDCNCGTNCECKDEEE